MRIERGKVRRFPNIARLTIGGRQVQGNLGGPYHTQGLSQKGGDGYEEVSSSSCGIES